MPSRLAVVVAGLLLAIVAPVQAQGPLLTATEAPRFEPWQAGAPVDYSTPVVRQFADSSRNRKRQALIGGAIGAAAGVVLCTAFSTLIEDSADGGLSFCPLDSNLLFGGAGFVLGAVIGWAI